MQVNETVCLLTHFDLGSAGLSERSRLDWESI